MSTLPYKFFEERKVTYTRGSFVQLSVAYVTGNDMKKIFGVLTAFLTCIVFSITVSATSLFYVTSQGAGHMDAADSAACESAGMGTSSGIIKEVDGAYYFDEPKLEEYTAKEQKEWILAFTNYLQNEPQLYASDRQVIFTNLKEMDNNYVQTQVAYLLNESSGSIHEATLLLKPVLNVVSLVLGFVAIIMTMGILIMTIVDLACMSIPFFSIKADGKKPKFMSADAFKAMKQSEDGDGNVYWLYFKRRFITYIVLVICIIFLVTGNLGGLFLNIADLFSGVTGVF